MPRLVSHPDEVKVVSRRFGQGAADIDKYVELGGYRTAKGLTSFTRWVARRLWMNHYLSSLLRSM